MNKQEISARRERDQREAEADKLEINPATSSNFNRAKGFRLGPWKRFAGNRLELGVQGTLKLMQIHEGHQKGLPQLFCVVGDNEKVSRHCPIAFAQSK